MCAARCVLFGNQLFSLLPAGIAKTSSSAYKGSVYNAGFASAGPAAPAEAADDRLSQA